MSAVDRKHGLTVRFCGALRNFRLWPVRRCSPRSAFLKHDRQQRVVLRRMAISRFTAKVATRRQRDSNFVSVVWLDSFAEEVIQFSKEETNAT